MNVREHRRVKNEQSREPGNIGYTKTKKNKKKTKTIYVGHHYAQTLRYLLYCYPNDCTGTMNNIYLQNFQNPFLIKK